MLEKADVNRALCKILKKSKRPRKAIAIESGIYSSHLDAIEKGTVPGVVVMDRILRALGYRIVLGDPDGETLETD